MKDSPRAADEFAVAAPGRRQSEVRRQNDCSLMTENVCTGSIMDPKTRFVGAVVLLGAPGAGKGTQSKIVAAQYGIPQISTGDLLRDNVDKDTELGKAAKSVLEKEGLVSDHLVEDMLAERIRTGGDT